MIKIHHNSNCGRVFITLLLIIGILGFSAIPVLADNGLTNENNDSVINEIKSDETGLNTTMCPPPVADFSAHPTEGCDSLLVYFTDLSTGTFDRWYWDFGDPASGTDNFSNDQNPTHMYRSQGTYTIKLTIYGSIGNACITKDHYIIIKTTPTADFTSDITETCEGGTVDFTDQSQGADTYYWEFGDGATSHDPNPSHTYTTPGNYNVKLTVSNICGDDDITKMEYITILPKPIADFTSDVTEGCESSSVTFIDRSKHAETWYWEFGDGATSYDPNPSHTYNTAGIYSVRLTVSNDCGIDDITKEEYIYIYIKPTADFTSNVVMACEMEPIQFTDLSTHARTWYWEFGDGATSHDPNPSHSYTVPGIYNVKLTVSNICGDDDITKMEYIIILPRPIADFTSDVTEGCESSTVTFIDRSKHAETWYWQFGDGGTSYDPNPSHTYTTAGVYKVKLIVSNQCGQDDISKAEYIYIYPVPTADFTSDVVKTCEMEPIQFTDLSSHARSWYWDFGDGATSYDPNPSHAYSKAGIYTVRLMVTNPCGQDEAVKIDYITVLSKPIADFTADTNEGCVGTNIAFTNLSSNDDSWKWNFGDGTTSVEENPRHTYNSPGLYTVTLTATNSCGPDDETKIEYIAIYPDPTAAFESDQYETCEGVVVTFTDKSQYAQSWKWDFGDGATSFDPNPVHTYTANGVYTVTLLVSNICGPDTSSANETIVLIPPPVAMFTAEPTNICEGGEVFFTNQSTYADSYSWDFGDGTGSPEENPSHIYTTAGKYTVTLTAGNICGNDTEIKTEYITVSAGPTADFEAVPLSGEAPLTVDFTDRSTSNFVINSWSWEFGDGSMNSVEQNPRHVYTSPGYHTVKLTVKDDCGQDVATKVEYIYVLDTCKIDFTFEPAEGCAELPVSFQGKSTGPCEISSWTWDFGDPASGIDNAASGMTAEHLYKNPGVYTVKLTAEDVSGTKSITKTDIITVYGPPVADFDASPTSGIAPLAVNFTDMSQGDPTIKSWTWDFGDPASGNDNTSSLPNPGHIYGGQGIYNVSLIVINDCGPDTAFGEINVSPAITITKAVDRATAIITDELLYTLTIKNNSENTIGNIVVLDTIPDSTSFIPGSITGGGLYNSFDNLVSWNLMNVAAGAELTLTFKVVIIGPIIQTPTLISNFATAVIDDKPAKIASPRTFISNIVTTIVDKPTGVMEIEKDVSASLASPGDELTYSITVTNRNPVPADDVVIYDAIPDSTTYIAGSISAGGIYDPATDSLMWDLGTMAAFESITVSFQVTIDPEVADGQKIPNTALVTSSLGANQSNEVLTAVSLTPIVVTKSTRTPSGMTGDLVRYTITVENYSDDLFTDVHLIDTMPGGIFYVDGSGLLNGASLADPIGNNPLVWILGDLPASGTFTVEYTALIGASAHPGINENVARAWAYQGGQVVNSNRAVAQIYVLGYVLTGSIRGIVVVDCDGDGIADMDIGPTGMDVYLDDGSQSRVNEKGMFYFSTVRPGERVVALDERDMEGYYVPEDAQASVFAHVHETGESYIIFRVCPEYPRLDITKQASIIPAVKVVKSARLSPEQKADSLGVMIDYKIDIKSNGLSDPTQVRVVDSFPQNTRLILDEQESIRPKQKGNELVYEVTAAQERLQKSVYYSLRDLTPGVRRFLTNKVHVEGSDTQDAEVMKPAVSDPMEVAVGPFMLAPPQDVQITLTPALFITSMADLQAPAIPQLQAVADSIDKYSDADIKVEGHTDYRRIHTVRFPSNWELGEARAKSVVDWLVENRGVDRDRLAYESFAATRPVVTVGKTSLELQPNRRTEVIIKAKIAGFLAPGVSPDKEWESSTLLMLDPVSFDTLFQTPDAPIEIGLDDSWEVVLTVENTSAVAAEDIVISDMLPDNVTYIDNSALIDGNSVAADVSGNSLNIKLKRVEPSQKLELRYRIRARQGTAPSGGGAASVEIKTANNQVVVQKSNEVRFK